MDLSMIEKIKEYVPLPVIVSVVAVIMLVYASSFIVKAIEVYFEEKYKKQIKIFDLKKIWLSLFWCIICAITLAFAKYIEWRELPFYTLVILGASSFLYEAFLKKMGVKEDDKKDTGGN